jgi:hypothetical protein
VPAHNNTLSRNNLDHKHTNNSGKLLLNICKESGLRILKGRVTGDITGKHTCFTYNGSSLVNYTLSSQDLLKSVGYFEILEFNLFSNHCPISCSLLVNNFSEQEIINVCKLDPLPGNLFGLRNLLKSILKISRVQHSEQDFLNLLIPIMKIVTQL